MILAKKPKTCVSASKLLSDYFKKDIFCTYNNNSFKVIYADSNKLRIIGSLHCSGVSYIREEMWNNLIQIIKNDGWEIVNNRCVQHCLVCGQHDYKYEQYWVEPTCKCCGQKYYWKTIQ